MIDEKTRAKVTKEFLGVRDGEVHPTKFPVGSYCWGDLASEMVGAGYAEWVMPRKEVKVRPEKKTGGPTGKAKRSSSVPAGQAKTKKTSSKRAGKPKSSS